MCAHAMYCWHCAAAEQRKAERAAVLLWTASALCGCRAARRHRGATAAHLGSTHGRLWPCEHLARGPVPITRLAHTAQHSMCARHLFAPRSLCLLE